MRFQSWCKRAKETLWSISEERAAEERPDPVSRSPAHLPQAPWSSPKRVWDQPPLHLQPACVFCCPQLSRLLQRSPLPPPATWPSSFHGHLLLDHSKQQCGLPHLEARARFILLLSTLSHSLGLFDAFSPCWELGASGGLGLCLLHLLLLPSSAKHSR